MDGFNWNYWPYWDPFYSDSNHGWDYFDQFYDLNMDDEEPWGGNFAYRNWGANSVPRGFHYSLEGTTTYPYNPFGMLNPGATCQDGSMVYHSSPFAYYLDGASGRAYDFEPQYELDALERIPNWQPSEWWQRVPRSVNDTGAQFGTLDFTQPEDRQYTTLHTNVNSVPLQRRYIPQGYSPDGLYMAYGSS